MSEYSRHGVSTVNGSGSIGFVSVFLLDSYVARVEMVGVVCRVQLTRHRLVIYTRLIAQAVARSDELRAEPQRADVHNYPSFFSKKVRRGRGGCSAKVLSFYPSSRFLLIVFFCKKCYAIF